MQVWPSRSQCRSQPHKCSCRVLETPERSNHSSLQKKMAKVCIQCKAHSNAEHHIRPRHRACCRQQRYLWPHTDSHQAAETHASLPAQYRSMAFIWRTAVWTYETRARESRRNSQRPIRSSISETHHPQKKCREAVPDQSCCRHQFSLQGSIVPRLG